MIRFMFVASIATLAISASSTIFADPPQVANSPGQNDFMVKHYPPGALKNGEDGKVGFRVTISTAGLIEQCEVTQSSGYETLDRETCDFIVQFASFKPDRDAKGHPYRTIQTGQMSWNLPPGVAKSGTARLASPALPPPLVCKRIQAAGSIRARTTQCMTNAEWANQDRLVRQELDGRIGSRPCSAEGC